MKIVLLIVSAVVLTVSSSCNKCYNCEKAGSPEVQICKWDYSTNDYFDQAVATQEREGYRCLRKR